jgi:hypothetical protein
MSSLIGTMASSISSMILETAVGVECCEISIGYAAYVGANLFARKALIMRINSHLQAG